MSAALASPRAASPAAASPGPWRPPAMPAPRLPRGIAPPSPVALAERAVGEALSRLGTEEHCLAKAREAVADAGRTHTRPITVRRRGEDRVIIPAAPFTAEKMAERMAAALARVAECEGRVVAAAVSVAEARRVLRKLVAAEAS